MYDFDIIDSIMGLAITALIIVFTIILGIMGYESLHPEKYNIETNKITIEQK